MLRLPSISGVGRTRDVKVAEFAIKMPEFNWKILATTGSLRATGRTKTIYDRTRRRQYNVDFPKVFQDYIRFQHAVDDNNRTRQDTVNFATAWASRRFETRHYMMCFAIAESNAMHMWNYTHPSKKHTKGSWRKAMTLDLLRSHTAPEANRRHNSSAPCRLVMTDEYTKWSPEQRRFIPCATRRVSLKLNYPRNTATSD